MRNAERTAQRAAEVVHDDLRLARLERVASIHGGVLQILEDASMVGAAAGLRDGGDVGDTGELRIVVGLADPDLLNGVERREHLVDRARVLNTNAADAVDGDAEQGGRRAHDVEVAAVVGLNAGLGGEGVDGTGRAGGTRVDRNRKTHQFRSKFGLRKVRDLGGDDVLRGLFDGHGLGLRSQLQGRFNAARLAGIDGYLWQTVLLEARRGDRQTVGANFDVAQGELPARVAGSGTSRSSSLVRKQNHRAGDDRARRILDGSKNRAEGRLRLRGRDSRCKACHEEEYAQLRRREKRQKDRPEEMHKR